MGSEGRGREGKRVAEEEKGMLATVVVRICGVFQDADCRYICAGAPCVLRHRRHPGLASRPAPPPPPPPSSPPASSVAGTRSSPVLSYMVPSQTLGNLCPGPCAATGQAAMGAMGDDDEEDEDFAASEEESDGDGSGSDSDTSGAEIVDEDEVIRP